MLERRMSPTLLYSERYQCVLVRATPMLGNLRDAFFGPVYGIVRSRYAWLTQPLIRV